VLSKLHPTLHENTSQVQIQKEFSDAISDAYTYYIQNGLIIRVNDVVVEEEHDWSSDDTCQLFNITTKIVSLEKDNDRVLFAIRTDKKTTYKKYDKESRGQRRLIRVDKNEIDQLKQQGYIISDPLKSSDIHAIEINSSIAFYSDLFDSENPPEPPLNHVHVHKDGRKYGSHKFEHRTDGNCNYNCHKIDFKSKKIGKELGITYNKQMRMDVQNDLTRMIREIISDNNSNLNSNTSTAKNQELCERYLYEMKVDIMTCPMRKLSTYHKERRELLAQPVVDPVVDPVVVPVVDPVVVPVVDPVVVPVVDPVVVPVVDPVVVPVVDPVVVPVVDPVVVPMVVPVVVPMVVPVVDPVVVHVVDLEYYITHGGTRTNINDMDENQLEALYNKVCSLLGRSFPQL
jgi:hypothetical protein